MNVRIQISLDLHTTSAKRVPFSVISDTLSNRRLALNLPAPIILGLEEHLDGAILNYINDAGYLAIGFEGGQNTDPVAVDHHEVAVWTMFTSTGCLPADSIPQLPPLRDKLTQVTQHVPKVLEIRFHQRIEEGTGLSCNRGIRISKLSSGTNCSLTTTRELYKPGPPAVFLCLCIKSRGATAFLSSRKSNQSGSPYHTGSVPSN